MLWYEGSVRPSELERMGTPTRVEAIIDPYNRAHDRYQTYYRRGTGRMLRQPRHSV